MNNPDTGWMSPSFLEQLRVWSKHMSIYEPLDHNGHHPNHTDEMDNVLELNAYYKWIDAGRPEGRDVEFWLAAEAEIFKPLPFYNGHLDLRDR